MKIKSSSVYFDQDNVGPRTKTLILNGRSNSKEVIAHFCNLRESASHWQRKGIHFTDLE